MTCGPVSHGRELMPNSFLEGFVVVLYPVHPHQSIFVFGGFATACRHKLLDETCTVLGHHITTQIPRPCR
eukprot:8200775-Karenia_brevis.AAC.1